ncbi:hypothetical protein CSC70_01790 [Pseudoxanthomonas kalamensis DSM 18571]|uniref:BatA domain-containing protein n=1 Tax=Pseudoxanthomonas kalamensis TaxID=289483 RepID=UPI001391FA31|nr:BatA domain-containing protein [Pseudoxanthomonas kalamensis]KAF1712280.1 hypothetical protein CSC70_01790 [Pseudoxanthomonas kalamensis DSM 18571]
MSLSLLLPAALAALGALLIPLLLHLARRSEMRPTPFAALQWLRQKPRPRHRIRFDEWALLLLRLLLLAGLAVWLAQPVLLGREDPRPYVAIAPGVDAAALDRDSLPADARLHWLAEGFPAREQEVPAPANAMPLASLLRQLDAELPAATPLTVIVPEHFDGADAQRPRLSRQPDWRIVAATADNDARKPTPPARPFVRYREDAKGLRYLRAAARAWRTDAETADDAALSFAPASQPLEATSRPLLWLGGGELPAAVADWIESGGTALVDRDTVISANPSFVPLWRDAQGRTLVEGTAQGRGRLLRFALPLQPQAMPVLLEPEFPQRLLALLQPASAAPTRAAAEAYAPTADGEAYPQPPLSLQPWLAVLLAFLFLLERWLATRRTRGPSP